MNQKKVDYNSISSEYDKRYSSSPLEGVKKKLLEIVASSQPENILEIGCGTGHWLNELSQFPTFLLGLDYSLGMLFQAKKSSNRISLTNADAGFLPFNKNRLDFIFSINAIHLFNDALKFIEDASALIKTNGTICIIGFDPHSIGTDWYVYNYFQGSFERDLARYPQFEMIKNKMEQSGLRNIKVELVEKINSDKHNCSVLTDHFLDRKGASQMALLNQDEYNIGINKIKTDLKKAVLEKYDIFFPVRLNFFAATAIK